jgi:hypothetical protein
MRRHLALCLLLAACAASPPVAPRAPATDPLAALPHGADAAAWVTPYHFSQQRAARLEEAATRLHQSDRPVARLALARALLDALLYAEIARDAPLLEALEALARRHHGDPSPWPWLRALLTSPAASEPEVRQAQADGLALVDALQRRALDAPYHAALARLADHAPLWASQARAARLLDLDEALLAARAAPLDERAALLRGIFGPALCAEGHCAPAGCSPQARGAALLAACGGEALGWPPSAPASLLGEDAIFLAALMRQGRADVAALYEARDPLARALTGALGVLEERLARLSPQAPVPAEALPPLPRARAEGFGQPERALSLRAGWLWVSAAPSSPLSLSPPYGWEYPGRPVAALDPARRALERGALARGWASAGQGEGPPLLWAGSQEPAEALSQALGLAREALGGGAGAWEARIGVWDPEADRPGWCSVSVLPRERALDAVPAPGDLPAQVREAWLLLDAQGAWWVVEGAQVGESPRDEAGALPLAALRSQARELSGLGAVPPVVRVRALGPGPRVGELVAALSALREAGLEVLLVP